MSNYVDYLNLAEQTNAVLTITLVTKYDGAFICEFSLENLYFRTGRWTPFVFFTGIQKPDRHRKRSSKGVWNAASVADIKDRSATVEVFF
jgi:hypothetical protein